MLYYTGIETFVYVQAGQSSLYVASVCGETKAVRLLLDYGADINLPTQVYTVVS